MKLLIFDNGFELKASEEKRYQIIIAATMGKFCFERGIFFGEPFDFLFKVDR